ncbi:MAG: lipopolysaccharide biosynthesis protein [Bacteroidales bacterium]|nr:lipopolysaccharide biosynthesis protein [Bacteroidales bacterium]
MSEGDGTLKSRTAHGIGWAFADNLSGSGVMALVSLVLARILCPEDFGLVAIPGIFISLANSLVDSGFSSALTRKKSVTEADFNTVFSFHLSVSLIIYIILFATAPLIAGFYGNGLLVPIIRILGLTPIITALTLVQRVILIRRLDFRTQAVVSFISSLAAGIAAITLAASGMGIWSLVALQIIRLGMTSFLLWLHNKWLPSGFIDRASFKDMFSFGGRLLLSAIVSIIWTEIYTLVIGKIYSTSVLGQYNRAEKFKGMLSSNISIVMQKVSYPVLSSVQDDPDRQLRIYRKVFRTTVLMTFTSILGLAAVSGALVPVLVGNQWLESVKYLQLLCLSGVFIPLIALSSNIINANGRSDTTLRLEIVKTIMAVIPIMAGIYFGIKWLLFSMAVVYLLVYFIYGITVKKIIGYKIKDQISDIIPFALISVLMSFAVWSLSLTGINCWLLLPLQLVLGAVITFVIYKWIYRAEEFDEILSHILNLLKRNR